jgi:2,3-bisphosphoglycerate-independent phosphoglycerate mutase
MRVLFLFLDGVGLGPDDPNTNPLAGAAMPNLTRLLSGQRLVAGETPLVTDRATVVALDACLGVPGTPQSATGQAALLTGRNVPAEIGYHYGPKPNPAVAAFLRSSNGAHRDNLFQSLQDAGKRSALLNAYPETYFAAIDSGRRLYSAIPLAVVSAGLALKTADDLNAGKALSADFTGQGWRERLSLPDTPLLAPVEAGARLAELAAGYELAFFEYWLSDYAGHGQDMAAALSLLATFDEVLGGLLAAWDDEAGIILITSDHGNLEDLSVRGHTTHPVPALVIGAPELRRRFTFGLHDLTDVTPNILRLLSVARPNERQSLRGR